eukprot:1807761-Prymnesium_polylepis.1
MRSTRSAVCNLTSPDPSSLKRLPSRFPGQHTGRSRAPLLVRAIADLDRSLCSSPLAQPAGSALYDERLLGRGRRRARVV